MTYSLSKGDSPITLEKTEVITLTCTWPAATDYDLYALVVYKDGTSEYIATFGAGKKGIINSTYTHPKKMSTDDGSVKHLGDVRRGAGTGKEIIEVRLNDNILAVVAVAYSAQSNGTGSFKQYKVTTEITAGSQKAVVKAENANSNKRIYTLVPGMIINDGDKFTVHPLELYSAPGNECRPTVQIVNGDVIPLMDQGPKNEYK